MTGLARLDAAARPPALVSELDGPLRGALARLDPPYGSSGAHGPGALKPYRVRPHDLPSPAVRDALLERAGRLDDALQAAGPIVALEEYRILCGMRAPAAAEEDIAREQGGFVTGTADLPAFALREACDAFRLGRIGDGEWMPKVGQVRREAERIAAPLRRQRHEIRAVLSAEASDPLADPEQRAAAAAMARDLAASMRASVNPPRRGGMTDQELREARALSEAIASVTPDPRPMPRASPELRRSLGLPPEPEPARPAMGSEHAA